MPAARRILMLLTVGVFGFAGAASAAAPAHSPLSQNPTELGAAKARAADRYASHQPATRARTASAPRAATVFGGLNKPGLGDPSTNDSAPSDSTGAIGPSHYVEMVNAKIAVFSRGDLTQVGAARSFGDFIGHPGENTFDPQMIWDQGAGRWFYLLDDLVDPSTPITNNGSDHLAFGWSKTADPTDLTNGWCHFRIDTDTKFSATGKFFADYPKLGHNDRQLAFGANLFDQSATVAGNEDSGFLTGTVFTVPKPARGTITDCGPEDAFQTSSKVAGTPTAPLRVAPGQTSFTPVPVNQFDSSSTGYVVVADSPTDGTKDALSAFKFDGNGTVSPTPVRLRVGAYDVPANARQPGTPDVLDTLDGRLTQAVGHADPRAGGAEAIWTQHTINGGAEGRSAVRWYELLPSSGQVRQQGTINDGASFVFNGAISPASDGTHAALDYSLSGPAQLPAILARSRSGPQAAGLLGPPVTLAQSAASMTDTTDCSVDPLATTSPAICRWGDYPAATPDPVNALLVWGSSQFVALANRADPGSPQWATRNFALNTRDAAPTGRFTVSPARTLTKRSVSFDARGSIDPDGRVVSYLWNFGGRQTSTSAHPRHLYGRPGRYRVTLTVVDDAGEATTVSRVVTVVNRAPLVSLRVLTGQPRVRRLVRFSARGSRDTDGRIIGYHWNFGGRQTSRLAAPIHVYGRAGRYRVTLTVTDDSHRRSTVRRTVLITR